MSRFPLVAALPAGPSGRLPDRRTVVLLAALILSCPPTALAQNAAAAAAGEAASDGHTAPDEAGEQAPAAGNKPQTNPQTNPQEAEFFEQNGQQPGVVKLHGGVQARQLSTGSGPAAAGADMVVLNLSRRGLLEAAASGPSGPASQHQQRYQVQALPKPLYEAIQLMHVGDRWEVYVPAQGKGRAVPGRRPTPALPATVFTVEVLAAH